jgi:hypothetical protein
MIWFVILAIAIESFLLAILLLEDLSASIVEMIRLQFGASTFYLVSVFLVLRTPPRGGRARLFWILGAALVFRLTVWPLFPSLSDDPYRYRWEGMLQAYGGNPYQVRPADPEWAHLRDATYPRIPAQDFKAGYGPLVELLELASWRAVSAATPDPWAQAFWLKLPGALFDLAAMGALCLLLSARGLPLERVLIYAWCPLPVMEFWAAGHNDSVAVLWVTLALAAAARDRWRSAFASLSLGVAAKLWPLLLFVPFLFRAGRRAAWSLVAVPILLLLAIPYWSPVRENVQFMTGFAGGWRNNDSLFSATLWLTGDLYRAKYLTMALIGAVTFVAAARRRWPLERAALLTVAATLFLSANCHPWYLTWFLPLLAILPVPALLLWTALAPLAYQVVIRWRLLGEWDGSTPDRWYVYVPVAAMFAFTALAGAVRRRRAPAALPASAS